MISSYLRMAFRNLQRYKGYAFINIAGLAIGLAAFWIIALYVADELSYDRYNTNAGHIYRVVQHAKWDGGDMNVALTSPPFARALKASFPEIKDAVRIDAEGGGVVRANDKQFKVNDIIFADKSLFKIFTYRFLYGDANTAFSNPASIVVTESLADRMFGSAAGAFNKTVYFDGDNASTITGVIKDVPLNSHLRFSVWWVTNKWLQDFAYREKISWWVFLLSGGAALLIALITISFQAVRAALANPVKSLRTE